VTLWFVPEERDAEALHPGRCEPGAGWTAMELMDVMAISGRTREALLTITVVKLTFDGDIAAVIPRSGGRDGPRNAADDASPDVWSRDVTLPGSPAGSARTRRPAALFRLGVWVTRSRVRFTFDMLFLPPDIEAELQHLYRGYLEWWLAKGNPARRRFPSDGLPISRPHDGVMVTVLREHGEWWLGLFRAILLFSNTRAGAGREAEA